MIFFLFACNPRLLIESGSYKITIDYTDDRALADTFDDFAVEEGSEDSLSGSMVSEENKAILEAVTLTIDIEERTANLTGTDFDIALGLSERPKMYWEMGCPMQLSYYEQQTFDINEAFELWGTSFHDVYLHAFGCSGEGFSPEIALVGTVADEVSNGDEIERVEYTKDIFLLTKQ